MSLNCSRRLLTLLTHGNRYCVRLKSKKTEKELVDLANIRVPNQYKGRQDALADGTTKIGEPSAATGMTMLSQDEDANIYILKYSNEGFRLKSGIQIVGPTAFFPRHVFHWNVRSAEDINEDSLSLFTLLAPKLDILVLGVGMQGMKVSQNVIQYLRMKKINFEILPTEQACATFNFLNADKRWVAAAMIPPVHMPVFHRELMESSYSNFPEIDAAAMDYTDMTRGDVGPIMNRVHSYWKGEGSIGQDARIFLDARTKQKEQKELFEQIKERGIERRKQERLSREETETEDVEKK